MATLSFVTSMKIKSCKSIGTSIDTTRRVAESMLFDLIKKREGMRIKYLILFVLIIGCFDGGKMSNPSPEFLKLWNFQKPDETRTSFEVVLNENKLEEGEKLQLQTQIARTYSLQSKFDESHAALDEIRQKVSDFPVANVRYNLERGRAYNSDNKKEEAKKYFISALELANDKGLEALAIDAAHMMAIAETDSNKQLEWNEKALEWAEKAKDPKAQGWKGSLYNNIGWTYHDKKDYQRALEFFQKGVIFREEQGDAYTLGIAKWTVARAYRSLEQYDKALEIQKKLYEENSKTGHIDGYNLEELAELYFSKGEKEKAKKYFKQAHIELSKDSWFVKNEPKRLKRIEELSK